MHVEGAVMGRGIDRHLAARQVEGDAALERLDHLHALERACLFDALRPQQHALIAGHGQVRDRLVVGAVACPEALQEVFVDRTVDGFEIVLAEQDTVAFLGGEHQLLVGPGEGRGRNRDLARQSGRGELPIERDRAAADQDGHDEVRLGCLDFGDRAAEIGGIEREELRAQDLSAAVLHELLHPIGGDLAVVVVGSERVAGLAPAFHRMLHEHLGVVRGRDPVDKDVAIAHAALVRHVVEVEGAVLVQYRSDHLPRCRGDAAVHDRDLVLQGGFLRVLGIKLHVGLGVEAHHFERSAQQAATGVHLLDREREHVVHRLACGLEPARQVVHAGDDDGVGCCCRPDEGRGEYACRRARHECPATECHGAFTPVAACENEQIACHDWLDASGRGAHIDGGALMLLSFCSAT